MAERYSRVFSLPMERYVPGCPVVLAAGALLRDNVTGGVLAQLKFRNICAKAIVGMKVRITPFDLAGKKLGDVEQDYLDMFAAYGTEFGQKTAVFLSDASARRYEVQVTQVVFADSTVLEQVFALWQPLPQNIPLKTWLQNEELCRQYRILHGRECGYRPQKQDGIQICACGSVNTADSKKCGKCGKNIEALLATDLDALKADMEARLEKARLEAEAKVAEEKRLKEEAAADRKKALIIIGAIAAAVLVIAIVYFTVISPAIAYSNAERLGAEGMYQEAKQAFLELGSYKDAEDRARENGYNLAKACEEERKYGQALLEYYTLGDYQDAEARVKALRSLFAGCIAAGSDHSVGLKSDGTVEAVGETFEGQCNVSKWRNIVAISAARHHTVGLMSDGTVEAIGGNIDGKCDVSAWTDIVAISAGSEHTVGLRSDGTVVTAGQNYYGQCDVSAWTDIVAISAGSEHTVGLRSDGTVVAVGSNEDGQCNVSAWTDIIAISAGSVHTVGLRSDGTVVAVGSNEDGQCSVSKWTNIVAVSAGGFHTIALKADGTAVAMGQNKNGQCNVSAWTDVVAVSAGSFHAVGVKADGTVVAAGNSGEAKCKVWNWTDIGPAR